MDGIRASTDINWRKLGAWPDAVCGVTHCWTQLAIEQNSNNMDGSNERITGVFLTSLFTKCSQVADGFSIRITRDRHWLVVVRSRMKKSMHGRGQGQGAEAFPDSSKSIFQS